MDKELTSGMLWNKASIDGLVLGAATVAFTILGTLCSKLGSFVGGLAGFLLLAGKITTCVLLVKFFLGKLHKETGVPAKTLYGYGLRLTLCSSVIVAAYSLFVSLQVSPEEYMEQVSQAVASMPVKLDSNTMDAMEGFLPKLPAINFFTTLVYSFLWGLVLSAMFSKSVAPSDPFEEGPSGSEL